MKIPYNQQKIFKEDIGEVVKSLKNNLITTGPYVEKFEKQIKKKLNVKFASVCSSGTAAITLAIKSIDTKKGDIFILPIINFICASNVLESIGAKIFYADVDVNTGQMTPKTFYECVKKNNLTKIKGFFTMYLGGNPNNIREFYKIKKKFGCYLIEDACHALGAKYKYLSNFFYVGDCKYSDLCTFSLHPVKTITSGEGGIVTTNNRKLKERINIFRSHGIIRKNNHWSYDVKDIGYNFRLSDINCALGLSQFKKLNKIVNERKKIYKSYKNLISKYNYLSILKTTDYSSFHLLIVNLEFNKLRKSKNDLMSFCKKKKIYLQQHYIPIYAFTGYKKKINRLHFPNAKYYNLNTFSIPIFLGLRFNQIKFILKTINKFILKNLKYKK